MWWARLLDVPEPGTAVVRALVAVLSDEFPPGSTVDLPGPGRPAGWQLAVFPDDVGRTSRIETNLPDAPLLWYVELPEDDAEPPATTLLAFSDDRYQEGTLLSAAEARAGGIGGAEQVAAIRWWPRSGLVHQLFVGPAHRRRGVAGKLGYVAFGLQAVRGLPELHGDGRRTRLGELFRQGLSEYAAARMAPWSSELPAMDL